MEDNKGNDIAVIDAFFVHASGKWYRFRISAANGGIPAAAPLLHARNHFVAKRLARSFWGFMRHPVDLVPTEGFCRG